MPLASGSQLGPYEILSPIGAGGMGEVYKARDSRLHRDVAIKLSNESFNDRFEKEARAVAALNHPNICTLHDVGPNYLVMELVEGPTLADRIQQGPIEIEEALAIARQIAEGLEAAHEKGITHRDLKPANIKVRPDGTVKVLDFGLAKLTEPAPAPNTNPANSPTLSLQAATRAGIVIGTAAYMAPEQAKGREVDKRADIWAFGVVLYEMVTGKRLFEGEDLTEILASVVKDRPDFTSAPASVRRLLTRCLEKDPKKRLRDISVAMELVGQDSPPPAAAAPSQKRTLWLLSALAAVLSLLLVASLALRPSPPPAPAPMKLEIHPFEEDLEISQVMVSPDASWIVMRSVGQLRSVIQSLSTGATKPLPVGVANLRGFSPDGKELLFSGTGKLQRLDLTSGGMRTVCACASNGGAAWAEDGTVWIANGAGPLLRVPASGGQPTPALPLDEARGETAQLSPVPLPDGKRILYLSITGNSERAIYLAPLDGAAKPIRVYPSEGLFGWIRPNLLLLRRGGNLAVVELDLATGVAGEPRLISDAVRIGNANTFSASGDGRVIAFLSGNAAGEVTVVDRSGKTVAGLGPATNGREFHPEFSPDGKRLVAERVSGQQLGPDVWVYDLERRSSSRLTFSEAPDATPVWSASGDRVYFGSRQRMEKPAIYEVAANGVGKERLLAETEAHHMHASPDGRTLAFEKVAGASGGEIWTLPLPQGGQPQPLLTGRLLHPRFSPDSRFLAYASDETGRWEIYIQTFPPGGGKWMVSKNGGTEPKWRADGKEIYFRDPSGIHAVPVSLRDQGVVTGEPALLFKMDIAGQGNHYAASPDGKLFAASVVHGQKQSPKVTLLLNWDLGARPQ